MKECTCSYIKERKDSHNPWCAVYTWGDRFEADFKPMLEEEYSNSYSQVKSFIAQELKNARKEGYVEGYKRGLKDAGTPDAI